MEKKDKVVLLLVLLGLVLSVTTFHGCSAAGNEQQHSKKKHNPSSVAPSDARFGSSVVLRVYGNVYPKGVYYALLYIGNPAKPYNLHVDTGSDLTWLQCDAPCVSCAEGPHPLYQPDRNDLVSCIDPLCASIQSPEEYRCDNPRDQCDYEVEYADHSSSLGVLLKDVIPFTKRCLFGPRLAFGCGYDQNVPIGTTSPMDGVLGLGNGKSSIVSQLRDMGLTRNVIGHCFSGRGGGYLFFGDDHVPSSGVVWTPMSSTSLHKHYSSGPTELIFGKKSTGVKGLVVAFDSGTTYTYFNYKAYKAFFSSLTNDLTGKPLRKANDTMLPVCWKGPKRFKTINDVKKYFESVILSFGKKTQLELPPEAYLIISPLGNVCLGILESTEAELEDLNVIGDISLQDKMVIYDNEKQQIGWVPRDCNMIPKVDREDVEGFSQPYASSMGILSQHYPATYGEDQ